MPELTVPEIKRVKVVFNEACAWIKTGTKKVAPTLDLAARAIFTCDKYWKKCQPGLLLLFLKCLIACASEVVTDVTKSRGMLSHPYP